MISWPLFPRRGELRQAYREGQEDQLGALGPVYSTPELRPLLPGPPSWGHPASGGGRHHAITFCIRKASWGGRAGRCSGRPVGLSAGVASAHPAAPYLLHVRSLRLKAVS